MKHFLLIFICCQLFFSCEDTKEFDKINPVNWKNRAVKLTDTDSLKKGQSYLSVYSEIYSITEHRTINLTVTVSLRNISTIHDIYLLKANYYNTKGDLIRTYFQEPIALKPLETIEIIIDEKDKRGGSGANFVFDWALKDNDHKPLFEAVMISTSGQQGISFTTQGVNL
ncbi:DUF3124 domain-containing protein [Xanthomarina sp. F2636L]|uniref:DUF3124 domain-containing protein n=1 Tax=Xanthomarina sp. F2636L TaxID=2996018 RepID=UPI00225DF773|nr:DUF3124 domain-containing protein [Xanthomarina sp. F2636L]MCX7551911.1 DUF3124 domain-containing protein [Xanthomarina sp. F2636L]